MPFNTISDLPNNVRHVLPKHAQDIYKEAFNHAYNRYKKPETRMNNVSHEEVAHKVAWHAVKAQYEKGSGVTWQPKKKLAM